MPTPPFTKEEMHAELRALLLGLGQIVAFVANDEAAFQLLKTPRNGPDDSLTIVDVDPANYVLDFSKWRSVEIFDHLYDFAFDGIARAPLNNLQNVTTYSFCAAALLDLNESECLRELAECGGPYNGAKCKQTFDVANARLVLTGHERMLNPRGVDGGDDRLTIRDIALLAGMTEPSVRNAAGHKVANRLQTYSEHGSTYVKPEDARSWLRARDRDIEITFSFDSGERDLLTTGFDSPYDLHWYLHARMHTLPDRAAKVRESCGDDFFEAVDGLAIGDILEADRHIFDRFATLLELDPELLRLRVDEVLLDIRQAQLKSDLARLRQQKGSNIAGGHVDAT